MVMGTLDQLRAKETAWKPKELMALLSLSKSQMYRFIEEGQLRAARFGTTLRIDPQDAVDWYLRNLTV
jgi:excisionase family DNA binding protein